MLTIVSGIARCGSTLTTSMLQAAGMRCPPFPYEPTQMNLVNGWPTAEWLSQFDAVKAIDPHNAGCQPPVRARVVWIDRDAVQQSRSQAKFIRMLIGVPVGSTDVHAIADSIIWDTPLAIECYDGMELLRLRFEDAIERTAEFCGRLAGFCGLVDTDEMLRCVRPREMGAQCQRGMDIELALTASTEAWK